MTITGIITLIAALLIILRLLTYRRRGRRYRPGVGVAAWACIAGCTVVIDRILATGSPGSAWLVCLLPLAATHLLMTGGNLAHLFRVPWRS